MNIPELDIPAMDGGLGMKLNVFIFGGSGFVGQHAAKVLQAHGYSVFIASRAPHRVRYGEPVVYQRDKLHDLLQTQQTPYALVNLAGESIHAGRWTARRRRRILDSRVELTQSLTEAIQSAPLPPAALVNASAVGYYGYSLTSQFTEDSPPGGGFLSDVTRQWEAEAAKVRAGTRVVLARLGMVLGNDGGALPQMLLPYKLFVGGRMGSGRQWVSWIHVDDVAHGIKASLERSDLEGPINFVSPQPVTMNDFGRTLGQVMHRPHWLPVPSWALRAGLGQMSEIVLAGQKVLPVKLQAAGYSFLHPSLSAALQDLLN